MFDNLEEDPLGYLNLKLDPLIRSNLKAGYPQANSIEFLLAHHLLSQELKTTLEAMKQGFSTQSVDVFIEVYSRACRSFTDAQALLTLSQKRALIIARATAKADTHLRNQNTKSHAVEKEQRQLRMGEWASPVLRESSVSQNKQRSDRRSNSSARK